MTETRNDLGLDAEAFQAACFSLAKACRWAKGPVDIDPIVRLAKEIEQAAERHVDYLQARHRDPNIVTRAIAYIQHHHGGPWGEHIAWLDAVLETLIELACPNTGSTPASEEFYQDLEEGIREARADFDRE